MRITINHLLWPVLLLMLSACHMHKTAAPVEEYSASQAKRQLNADGSYRVRSGDTLYAIAFTYGLDHREVAAWNSIKSPYVIYPGQNLDMSAPASYNKRGNGSSATVQTSGITSPVASTTRSSTTNAAPSSSKSNTGKTTSSKNASKTTTKPVKQATQSKPDSTVTGSNPKVWQWPTTGRLVHTYVAANPARNGLDIAGKEGQAIKASAAGKVVYSGNGLIAYGELIIIKHSETMLSAYAHNKTRLVQEGAEVKAGQKIAEMGRNDRNEPLLHFEIRARGKPVDPLRYLPAKK